MKVVKLFFLSLLILTFSGCTGASDLQQLNNAYHLIDVDSIDEADMIVNIISDTDMSDEVKAIYNLTKVRLNYKQNKSVLSDTALIDFSIYYYKTVNPDKFRLSEAYFYKGTIFADCNNLNRAILNYKDAENQAKEIDNPESIHKVYEQLCLLYYNSNLYEDGVEYAHKALELAKKVKNYDWYAYAADYVSYYYLCNNMNDSASYYINSIEPYIKKINKKNLPIFLANLAHSYSMNGETNKAIEYLHKSIDLRPSATSYNSLAAVYIDLNKTDSASYYLNKALTNASLSDSISTINQLSNIYYKEGNFEEACSLLILYNNLQSKLRDIDRENDLAKIKAQYNTLSIERNYQKSVQKISLIIFFLIIALIALFYYNSMRMIKMKREQMKDQLLIDIYNTKIKDLESSEQTSTSKVEELKKKVTKLQEKQNERLSEGKKLYEHVLNNGSIISWEKQDYSNMFDYYNLIDMPFLLHVERDYDNLSSRSILYLILCNMGKTEEEIEKIFGISSSSVRSIKSRTKSRLKVTEE